MDPRLLPEEFKEFLSFLNLNEAKYLVLGGWAVGLYGNPRATGDIDILIGTDDENLEKIVKTIEQFGIKGVEKEYFKIEGNGFRIGQVPLKIELLTYASGIKFEECYANKKFIAINELKVPFISKGDLIKNKRASGRPKDIGDLEYLE